MRYLVILILIILLFTVGVSHPIEKEFYVHERVNVLTGAVYGGGYTEQVRGTELTWISPFLILGIIISFAAFRNK